MQEKTGRVDKVGGSVGLKISLGKTQIMKMKNKSNAKTTVHGTDLEKVQHFKDLGSYISADSNIDNNNNECIYIALSPGSLPAQSALQTLLPRQT